MSNFLQKFTSSSKQQPQQQHVQPSNLKSSSSQDLKSQLEMEAKKITQDLEGLLRSQPPSNQTQGNNTNNNVTKSASHQSSLGKQKKQKFILKDFHVQRTLGTGSFGRVHLVQKTNSDKFLAMKVMKKTEVVRLKQVEHTMNEKKILEIVDFPFLVNMLGSFQDSQNLYFIMEYVPGGELFSLLRRSQRFSNNVAKFYAAEVVLAFEYLHSKDIIYRDLKPENLLINSDGNLKITDFGFAKYVPDVTWTLCGTPDYLAPEIIQSRGYGKAVDWYALGVLIFEMLAGYPPFFDEDHVKLYEKILSGKVRYPSNFEPHAKDLIKHLLSADLSKRYGNLKGGSADIKNHKWFEDMDWRRLLNLEIAPPHVPKMKQAGDTSHFDQYEENTEAYGVNGPDPYADKFKDF